MTNASQRGDLSCSQLSLLDDEPKLILRVCGTTEINLRVLPGTSRVAVVDDPWRRDAGPRSAGPTGRGRPRARAYKGAAGRRASGASLGDRAPQVERVPRRGRRASPRLATRSSGQREVRLGARVPTVVATPPPIRNLGTSGRSASTWGLGAQRLRKPHPATRQPRGSRAAPLLRDRAPRARASPTRTLELLCPPGPATARAHRAARPGAATSPPAAAHPPGPAHRARAGGGRTAGGLELSPARAAGLRCVLGCPAPSAAPAPAAAARRRHRPRALCHPSLVTSLPDPAPKRCATTPRLRSGPHPAAPPPPSRARAPPRSRCAVPRRRR
jgi:hypothetical protein